MSASTISSNSGSALIQKLKATIEVFGDEIIWNGQVEIGFPSTAYSSLSSVSSSSIGGASGASSNWKRPKKLNKRILALSKYRFFLFGKTLAGKYTLSKDYHYLFLKSVNRDEDDSLILEVDLPKSKVPLLLFIKSKAEVINELAQKIYQSYKQITYGWPDYVTCNFSSVLNYSTDQLLRLNLDTSGVLGLIHTLKAYSNLNAKDIKPDVIHFLEDCQREGITDLKLTECPGIERRSPLFFDLPTLAYALRHHSYFKSFELRNIEHRDAILAVALILMGNSSISRVVCTNSNTEVNELLGMGLEMNRNNNLQILQLTGCKFTTKAVVSFAKSLRTFNHLITVLDLSNSLIGNGLMLLLDSLSTNWGFALGIEELSIAGNQLTAQVAQRFALFLFHIRRHTHLRRLSVANTGIDIGSLALEVANLESLQYLNLSDNRVSKVNCPQVSFFTETIANLQVLRFSSIGFDAETMKRTLDLLFFNKKLRNLHLDISRNAFGPEGTRTLLSCFKIASNLQSLDLSDNDIREKVGVELLKILPQSICHLSLNRNFGTSPDTPELCAALGSFVATHVSCQLLEISGSSGYRLGAALIHFFVDLGKNGYLKQLDISANNIGDEAFSYLCGQLRSNDGLRSIITDNNYVTYVGYKSFLQMLKQNRTLTYLEFPMMDFKRAQQDSDRFYSTVFQINNLLAQRQGFPAASGGGGDVLIRSPFTFDLQWPTPSTPVKPLLEVPPELKVVSEQLKKELGNSDIDQIPPMSATSIIRSTEIPPADNEISLDFKQESNQVEQETKKRATMTIGGHLARSFTNQGKMDEDYEEGWEEGEGEVGGEVGGEEDERATASASARDGSDWGKEEEKNFEETVFSGVEERRKKTTPVLPSLNTDKLSSNTADVIIDSPGRRRAQWNPLLKAKSVTLFSPRKKKVGAQRTKAENEPLTERGASPQTLAEDFAYESPEGIDEQEALLSLDFSNGPTGIPIGSPIGMSIGSPVNVSIGGSPVGVPIGPPVGITIGPTLTIPVDAGRTTTPAVCSTGNSTIAIPNLYFPPSMQRKNGLPSARSQPTTSTVTISSHFLLNDTINTDQSQSSTVNYV